MLAPYPDRLRSSRSTAAQGTSTTPTPEERDRSTRLTRMRTNSLSSPPSPLPSHRSDSSKTSNDPSSSSSFSSLPPSRPSLNPPRRPVLPSRPSTSPATPDHKQLPSVPIIVTSPFGASPIPVRLDSLLPTIACQSSSYPSPLPVSSLPAEGVTRGLLLHAKKATLPKIQKASLSPHMQTRLKRIFIYRQLIVLSSKTAHSVALPVNLCS
jgi:hypothetical protein